MWKKVLAHFDSLEEVFEVLGVPFESSVVKVHRLRILRRFGNEMRAILGETARDEAALKQHCAETLATIYDQCSRGMREPIAAFRGLEPRLVQLRRKPS